MGFVVKTRSDFEFERSSPWLFAKEKFFDMWCGFGVPVLDVWWSCGRVVVFFVVGMFVGWILIYGTWPWPWQHLNSLNFCNDLLRFLIIIIINIVRLAQG